MRTSKDTRQAGGAKLFAAIICAGALCGGRTVLAGDNFSPVEVTEAARPVRAYLTAGLGGGSIGLAVMGSANVEIGSLLLSARVSATSELFGPGLSTAQEMTAYLLLAGYAIYRGAFGFYTAAGLGLANSPPARKAAELRLHSIGRRWRHVELRLSGVRDVPIAYG